MCARNQFEASATNSFLMLSWQELHYIVLKKCDWNNWVELEKAADLPVLGACPFCSWSCRFEWDCNPTTRSCTACCRRPCFGRGIGL